MYNLLYILLLAIAVYFAYKGIQRKQTGVLVTGIILGVLTPLFFWFMWFWGEKLWFDQTGYPERFWIAWLTKLGLFATAFLAGGLLVFFLTFSLPRENKVIRYLASLAGALISGTWWYNRWELYLKFTNRTTTGITEPILNKSTDFYLFTYPFLQSLMISLIIAGIIAIAVSLLAYAQSMDMINGRVRLGKSIHPAHSLFISTGYLLLVLGVGRYISRFDLLFSDYGIINGAGWTDANIKLPLLTVTAVITILAGIVILIPRARTMVQRMINKSHQNTMAYPLYLIPGVIFALWFILLGIVPSLFQWLKVEPNEITVEKPYIENNIRFTRRGFHLNKVEEKEFTVSEELKRENINQNQNLLDNIRLWDYRALDAVFKQFQEIRLYYEFNDVDIDRYHVNNKYREVMVSAREMETSNLPPNSQTFVNKRFKYTHGFGAVLNLVNEFTPEGLPNLLIKDIPPESNYENLDITRPEIYYGEISSRYVVANSEEKEFDYPSGEKNIYTRYQGDGGVPVSNMWRKILYGWEYGGTKFLLSDYPTRKSRIMLHRDIKERVQTLAPFLQLDDDPYIVIVDGKLYWILDAYTSSAYYPYSEPYASINEESPLSRSRATTGVYGRVESKFNNKNYLRNSVKIVVNAYNGDTDFYIFEPEDPLIQVYNRIFPGLLKQKSAMPEGLRSHVRYPSDILVTQGLVYAKYHMTDPAVFYNQEDLWVRATEKYYNTVQPVEPYYIMWEPPGSDEMEFVLILPFTPKNKQVMIGWIAGMCDDENYGRFLAYQFPKEKRVLGTQQVETKIDQDSYLSGQLTLWDQRGSNVIRGNVLAIPIDNTMIYVEPIYLQSETSAYPELRLVTIMHNDNLSYAESFDQALEKLLSETAAGKAMMEAEKITGQENMQQLIDRANEAFENYLQHMNQRNFSKAGDALKDLEQSLQEMTNK